MDFRVYSLSSAKKVPMDIFWALDFEGASGEESLAEGSSTKYDHIVAEMMRPAKYPKCEYRYRGATTYP